MLSSLTPQFCLIRSRNPNPAIGQLILLDHGEYHYVPFSNNKPTNIPPFPRSKFLNEPKRTTVVQSCNGLLLCHNFCTRDFDNKHHVYNPTTDQVSRLPRINGPGGISLAFDPARSPHYKVIFAHKFAMLCYTMEYHYQLHVYSSESRAWRKLGEAFSTKSCLENGVYWNRAVHWFDTRASRDYCLYFNIDDSVPRVMPMPMPPMSYAGNSSFGESCDHLHYVTEEIIWPKVFIVVYEMRRDYSEWFVKYKIDLSPVADAYNIVLPESGIGMSCFLIHDAFCLVRGEKDEDSFLVLRIREKVVQYDIVDQRLKTIFEVVDDVPRYPRSEITRGFQYIESLYHV